MNLDVVEQDKSTRPRMKSPLFLFSVVYFVGLVVLIILIYLASPGPASQEILGVSMGRSDEESGVVHLSGRRLDCVSTAEKRPYTTQCIVDIAEKPLVIYIQRNSMRFSDQLPGICEAFYDGQNWPCQISFANASWFAYLERPLGLEKTQMNTLRQRYFIENLPEDYFILGSLLVTILTTLIVVANLIVWRWPKTNHKTTLVFPALFGGGVTFAITFFFMIWLTRGFWD